MKAEIKSFVSVDILDLKHYIPDDKESFSFLLELKIGIAGKEGADEFSVEVCTPKWLLENHQSIDVVFGRYKIIVFEYDIDNIINTIKRYLDTLSGNTWESITTQISKIAQWEFENYKP